MKNRIEENDIVSVYFIDDAFNFKDAIVVHVPNDISDVWNFRTKDKLIAVNPCASTLIYIVKQINN